ncbi:MAG: DNA replication/repair protein RecF [Alphaproteobacteria bacterium]|nr:DNA replication/repair protein RecF [Alphaproteobacteria bacterium]
MPHINALLLENFRSYDSLRLESLESGLVLLTGANGAGKTNILEALSLLAPGKGLRNTSHKEWQKQGTEKPWVISALVTDDDNPVQIGTTWVPEKAKRVFHLNGAPTRTQEDVLALLNFTWLTPKEDRLFVDAASDRRRFYDRLVFQYDAAHAGRVRRFENAMRERNKILKEQGITNTTKAWLDSLEQQMAETACAIGASRQEHLRHLQDTHEKQRDTLGFSPAPTQYALHGYIETLLIDNPALQAEEIYRKALEQNRKSDRDDEATALGPHRTDFTSMLLTKNQPAPLCSTGEQKALLFGLLLAQAEALNIYKGIKPILLLDDVAAHLDADFRGNILKSLLRFGTQTWVSATGLDVLEPLPESFKHITVGSH